MLRHGVTMRATMTNPDNDKTTKATKMMKTTTKSMTMLIKMTIIAETTMTSASTTR